MIEIFLYFMWVEGWVDISSTKQPNDWMWFNLVVSTNTNNYFIRRPVRLPKALYVVHFHCDSFYTTLSKSCCQYGFFCHKLDALMHWLLCRFVENHRCCAWILEWQYVCPPRVTSLIMISFLWEETWVDTGWWLLRGAGIIISGCEQTCKRCSILENNMKRRRIFIVGNTH